MPDSGATRKNMYAGSISYDGLWEMMKKRGISKMDLRNPEKLNLSPTLISKLVKNENVAVDTIMYLCDRLDCQPCDILEYRK